MTADLINTTSTSGGTLAWQTAALTLNMAFSAAGLLGGSNPLGDLCAVSIHAHGAVVEQLVEVRHRAPKCQA